MSDRPPEQPPRPEAPSAPEPADAPDPSPPTDRAEAATPADAPVPHKASDSAGAPDSDEAPDPVGASASAETPGRSEPAPSEATPDPDEAPVPAEAVDSSGSASREAEADEAPTPAPASDAAPEPASPQGAAAEAHDSPSGQAADAAPRPSEAPAPADATSSDPEEAPSPAEAVDPDEPPEPAEPTQRAQAAEPVRPAESPAPDVGPDQAEAPVPAEAVDSAGSASPEADEAPTPAPASDEAPASAGPEYPKAPAEGGRTAVPESSGNPERPDDEVPELELELKPYDDSVPYSAPYTASLGAEQPREAAGEASAAPEPPDAPEPAEAPGRSGPAPSDAASDSDEAPVPAEAVDSAGSGSPEADEAPVPVPASDEAVEPPSAAGDTAVASPYDADAAPDPIQPNDSSGTPGVPSEPVAASEASGPEEAPPPNDAAPATKDAPGRHDRVGAGDDAVEGGVWDALKQRAGRGRKETGRSEHLTGTVDHPAFQNPARSPADTPDRYGTPLDRADGTRTPLFDGEPSREQAKQGALNDCGVVATLGAVASHRPEAIRECVRETGNGNYEVTLHEAKFNYSRYRYEPTGSEINLTVTSDLPVYDADPDSPAFADSVSTGTAWAPVLEKAIAGSDQMWDQERRDRWVEIQRIREAPEIPEYVRLDQGTSPRDRAELLTQLTGRPASVRDFPEHRDPNGLSPDRQLIGDMRRQLAEGKPVLVGTRSEREIRKEFEKRTGRPLASYSQLTPSPPGDIAWAHAYEVTGVDDRGGFHLHNPWQKSHLSMTLEQFKKYVRPRYTTLE
ncbi:hypothetical protein PL81_37655 [Streptomyces sp. RSD-27]|nr:hypothetical protein PL81_37655 [Streptomyces sp. RSD-27]